MPDEYQTPSAVSASAVPTSAVPAFPVPSPEAGAPTAFAGERPASYGPPDPVTVAGQSGAVPATGQSDTVSAAGQPGAAPASSPVGDHATAPAPFAGAGGHAAPSPASSAAGAPVGPAGTPPAAPAAYSGLVSPPEATIPPVLTTTLDLPPDRDAAQPAAVPAKERTKAEAATSGEPAPGWATGYIGMSAAELAAYARAEGLQMPLRDLLACQDYFRSVEQRNPTLTELRSLAACRAHQEFETLVQIPLYLTRDTARVLRAYFDAPAELFATRPSFRKTGALVALVALPAMDEEFSLTGWRAVRSLLERVTELVEQGYVEVAASVTGSDLRAAVSSMCENGGVGFAFGREVRPEELLQNAVGGLLLELSGGDMCLRDLPHQILGTTVEPDAAPDARA